MNKIKFDDWIERVTIIIDTQEKKIDHITRMFDKLKVNYTFEKLKFCDYGVDMDGKRLNIFIERKNSLDEISQNFSKNRDRFKREFEKLGNSQGIILIENNSLTDLFENNYRSNLHVNSFIASMLTFENRYGLKTYFIDKNLTAILMLRIFYYFYYCHNSQVKQCVL